LREEKRYILALLSSSCPSLWCSSPFPFFLVSLFVKISSLLFPLRRRHHAIGKGYPTIELLNLAAGDSWYFSAARFFFSPPHFSMMWVPLKRLLINARARTYPSNRTPARPFFFYSPLAELDVAEFVSLVFFGASPGAILTNIAIHLLVAQLFALPFPPALNFFFSPSPPASSFTGGLQAG